MSHFEWLNYVLIKLPNCFYSCMKIYFILLSAWGRLPEIYRAKESQDSRSRRDNEK